jgi:hypothetical protein
VSGGTSPIGSAVCSIASHVGNIKCDSEYDCEWVEDGGSYNSGSNVTVNPTCSDGGERTLCIFVEGTWVCQDYAGDIITTYSNCERCEVTND